MTESHKNKKSVVDSYTKNALIFIVLSAISIGGFIGLYPYYEFTQASNRLEQEKLSSYKKNLQREVARVEELIKFERSKLQSIIRTSIKDRVYEAHAIATGLYEKYKDTKSRDEIETLVIEALRPHGFFNKRGYFYAISLDGISKLSPITPQFEGTSILDFKTNKGIYFIKEMIDIAKSTGEGFYDHTWSKPSEEGVFDKISFVKHFKPFDWILGTGDYVVDVERQIQNKILEQIGKIRFGKEGYIFVVNYDGTVMMNMGQPSIIGKNIIHVTDANGIRVAEEVIKLAQDSSWDGYFKYHWEKRSSSTIAPKIAYHKMVPEWRWYYGTGIYVDDINAEIALQRDHLKEGFLLQLFIILMTIVVAVSVFLFLSKKRTYELNNDLKRLLTFFESLSIKSNSINTDEFEYSEFKQIAESANLTLEKQKKSEKQRLLYEEQIQQNQKMVAANQIIGGVSHDFNNLLGAILGYGELLELKLDDNKKLKEYAHQINTAGKRGARLTKKLLSLTRNISIEAEDCDLNSLLRDEEELLKKSLTAKISLKMHLKDGLWPVFINKSDFEDVILNLCVNAMHAMREGQQDSEIIISTDHVHLDREEHPVSDLEPGDYVQVSVFDNGLGMDAKTKERIFEPFFTTREEGHGLGLSQVFSFVKQNKGSVFVQSTENSGTTFEMLIPRNLAMHDSPVSNEQAEIKIEGNETILVVDDESALRTLNTDILSEQGYRVFQAENGVEALFILEQEKIDLVLSDVIMPNMDGNILAEKIRKLYSHIKIQLISGYTKQEDISLSNHDLHKDLLRKPVKASDLLQRIRFLLNDKADTFIT